MAEAEMPTVWQFAERVKHKQREGKDDAESEEKLTDKMSAGLLVNDGETGTSFLTARENGLNTLHKQAVRSLNIDEKTRAALHHRTRSAGVFDFNLEKESPSLSNFLCRFCQPPPR